MAEEQGDLLAEETPPEETPETTEPQAEAPPTPEPAEPPRPDPVAELERRLEEEREARIRLEGMVQGREQAKPAEPKPQEISRTKLRELVNEGRISEDQMEEIWAKQNRESLLREVDATYSKRLEEQSQKARVDAELQKYIDARPTISQRGSEDWIRVKQEFDYLVQLGDPPDSRTELKAARAAFGPAERVREHTTARRPTHAETSSPRGQNTEPRNVDIFNRIPKSLREYYRFEYENGRKTIDEIKRELPYMENARQ